MAVTPWWGNRMHREPQRSKMLPGVALGPPHVCHGVRHASSPTLYSLASLLFSEFKPKVHGEGAVGGPGNADGKRQQRADLERCCSQETAFLKFSGRNEENPGISHNPFRGTFISFC